MEAAAIVLGYFAWVAFATYAGYRLTLHLEKRKR